MKMQKVRPVIKMLCFMILIPMVFASSLAVSASGLSVPDAEALYKAMPEYLSGMEFRTAIDEGNAYLAERPDDALINWYVGEAYLHMSEPAEAMPYFRHVRELLPDDPAAQSRAAYFIALCNYYTGKTADAENNFNECIDINGDAAFTGYAGQMLKTMNLLPYFDNWSIVETDHFIFHFHPVFNAEQIDEYSKKHEEAYVLQNQVLQSDPIKKIDEFVWDSEASAINATGQGFNFSSPTFCIINSLYTVTAGHLTSYILVFWMKKPADLLAPDLSIRNNRFINQGTGVYFNDQKHEYKLLIRLKNRLMVQNGLLAELDVTEQWKNDSVFDSVYPSSISQVIAGDFIEYLVKRAGAEKYKALLLAPSFTNAEAIYGNDLSVIIKDFESTYARNYRLFIALAAFVVLIILIRMIRRSVRRKRNKGK
jgi:tetratricopeptide (TPR) repeat protein